MANVSMPTIEVTQEQADRIMAAFMAKFGTTTSAETIKAYKAELTRFIVQTVIVHETNLMVQQDNLARKAKIDELKTGLPPIPNANAIVDPNQIPPPPPPLQS